VLAPAEAQPTVPPVGSSVFQSTQPPRMVELVTVFSSMVGYLMSQPGALDVAAGAVTEVTFPVESAGGVGDVHQLAGGIAIGIVRRAVVGRAVRLGHAPRLRSIGEHRHGHEHVARKGGVVV